MNTYFSSVFFCKKYQCPSVKSVVPATAGLLWQKYICVNSLADTLAGASASSLADPSRLGQAGTGEPSARAGFLIHLDHLSALTYPRCY